MSREWWDENSTRIRTARADQWNRHFWRIHVPVEPPVGGCVAPREQTRGEGGQSPRPARLRCLWGENEGDGALQVLVPEVRIPANLHGHDLRLRLLFAHWRFFREEFDRRAVQILESQIEAHAIVDLVAQFGLGNVAVEKVH